ncbi:hypothetical protein SEA_JANUS_41 [Streptomyces phage Janus]|uniref:Uncharacterized protein n=1 Tax=Streptomyces phage Janus TaxID=2510525 RepID=A0A411CPW1_9CAUD|nr:hypothetical protein KGG75_gp41 [Streptomyces phage Janus]QAY15945.1 hypothetical protein SEA_JANUS_41 [Streptomyces phage Janus]
MADTETIEAEKPTTRKKAPARKPDPMARILNDIRAAAKSLGEYATNPAPEHRVRHHDGRASAWGRQYAHEGTIDALVLSLTFEALSSLNPAEERYSLTQLAAVVLARIEQIDEAGQ